MPIFVCKDIDCPRYGIEDTEAKVSYKEIKGELIADKATCPLCGSIREEKINNPEFKVSIPNKGKRKWSRSTKNTIY